MELNIADAIKKATELKDNFVKYAKDYMQSSGKSEFTLSDIVPGWDKIDGKIRDLIGDEFKERVVKKGLIPELVEKGQNSSGVDLYGLK